MKKKVETAAPAASKPATDAKMRARKPAKNEKPAKKPAADKRAQGKRDEAFTCVLINALMGCIATLHAIARDERVPADTRELAARQMSMCEISARAATAILNGKGVC